MTVQLTRRELDLMSVVWEQGSATVSEVMDRLPDDPHYSTVMTIFRTLEAKGHVRHERHGKAFRYYPLIAPDDVADGTLSRLVNKVYQGSRELLITRLVADEDISPEELRRMRDQLDRRIEELET